MERTILHVDLNNFFASVECKYRPELKGGFMAVCGSVEDRHGIVLAKNQRAKLMGVKTGMTIKEAEKLYKTMGERFVLGDGQKYYVISPHDEFEKYFGKEADKRRKLYNGMIKCQLFMYFR